MTNRVFVPIAQSVLVDFPLFDFEIDLTLQLNDGATELLDPARDKKKYIEKLLLYWCVSFESWVGGMN